MFSKKQVLGFFEHELLVRPVNRAVFNAEWTDIKKAMPRLASSMLFCNLFNEHLSGGRENAGEKSLMELMKTAEGSAVRQMLLEHLRAMVALSVGSQSDKIDTSISLNNYGLDSLMSNEVRIWIGVNTGVEYPIMKLMQGPSIDKLADDILEEFAAGNLAAKTGSDDRKWLAVRPGKQTPVHRLVCFPYMGAGASVFNGWREAFPDTVEICPVQAPGREMRKNEKSVWNGLEIFSAIAGELKAMSDIPFSVYGHSFGAHLALDFAMYMHQSHSLLAQHLFIGASIPPSIDNPNIPVDDIKSFTNPEDIPEEIVRKLLINLGMPSSTLESNAFAAILPAWRTDLMIYKQRRSIRYEKCQCPITVMAGKRDKLYPMEFMPEWRQLTDKEFTICGIEGEHMFLEEPACIPFVADIIKTNILKG
jgi:surfactin synthase thioesterase subunit